MDRNEALLVAELAQATVALLALLNRARREDPSAKDLLTRLLADAGYEEGRIGSLLNQGTLLGYSYLTLVWLWEKQPALFADRIPDRPLDDPARGWLSLDHSVLEWETGLKQPAQRALHPFLRHLRNSLSHGRVTFEENGGEAFLFADALPGSTVSHTRICLLPAEVGQLCDLVLRACQRGTRF